MPNRLVVRMDELAAFPDQVGRQIPKIRNLSERDRVPALDARFFFPGWHSLANGGDWKAHKASTPVWQFRV